MSHTLWILSDLSGVSKFKSIKIEIRFLSLELIMLTQSFTSGLVKNSHHDPSLCLRYIYTRDTNTSISGPWTKCSEKFKSTKTDPNIPSGPGCRTRLNRVDPDGSEWTKINGPEVTFLGRKNRVGENSRNNESLLQCRWRSRDEPWMEVGLNSQWKVCIYMSIRQGTFSGRRYSYGTLHFLFLKIQNKHVRF